MPDYSKFYKFELSLGGRCNFKCKYCFEPDSPYTNKNTDVTLEQILRFADYIKFVKASIGDDSIQHTVSAFGGETLLYLDLLKPFVQTLRRDVSCFTITTNGALVKKHLIDLLWLRRISGQKFDIITSYDFIHQDEMRQKGTYNLVRDSIRLLADKGFPPVCLTVFDGQTLPLAWERFEDFLKLKEELPDLIVKFNLSRNSNDFDGMDEEKARKALEKIRDYIGNDTELARSFLYNPSFLYRGNRLPYAFFGSTISAMSMNGEIYPGYDVPFISDFAKDTLRIGNVMDDFQGLEERRNYLMSILPIDPPSKCLACSAICRVLPWARMTDSIQQYNMTPDEQHCYIHKLVSEYISYRRPIEDTYAV